MIDSLKHMATDWPVGTIVFGLFAIAAVIVAFVIFGMIDIAIGNDVTFHGKVIEKSYTPARNSTGIGPAIGGNGGVAVTFSHEDEKPILFVKHEDGFIDDVVVDRNVWFDVKVGDTYTYEVRLGRFTGWRM